MSETDEEFLSRLQPSWPGTNDSVRLPMSDFDRLFALARRGAEAADEIERLRALLKAIRNFPNLSTYYGTLIVPEIDAALKEDGK